jgi:hypothetical protein
MLGNQQDAQEGLREDRRQKPEPFDGRDPNGGSLH